MKKIIFSTLVAIILVGCGSSSDVNEDTNQLPVTTLPSLFQVNEGRLLGSQCAQCHGTNGYSVTSWDSIAGDGEFASKNFHDDPIMQAIADGYNSSEKVVIDSWLNSVPESENDNDNDDD